MTVPSSVVAVSPGVVVTQALPPWAPVSTRNREPAGTWTTQPGPRSLVSSSMVICNLPSRTSRTSSRLGRWATPLRPGGTVSRHAHNSALPRLGLTYAAKVLPWVV